MNLNPAKSDEWFNHEKSFCEGLQSLNWLCMDGLPRPYIQGQLEASDFYLTKCLSAGKDLDDTKKAAYRAYVKTFKELLKAEAQFAVDFFKTGLSWKAGGSDLPKAGAAPAAAAAKPANPLAAKPNPLAAAIGAKAAGAKKAGGFKLPAKKAAPAVTEGKIDKSQMNKVKTKTCLQTYHLPCYLSKTLSFSSCFLLLTCTLLTIRPFPHFFHFSYFPDHAMNVTGRSSSKGITPSCRKSP